MRVILLSAVWLISTFVYSGDIPAAAVKASLAAKSLLLDIAVIDENKLIAVGERGHILTSYDGTSWEQMNVPLQTTLTQVSRSLIGTRNTWFQSTSTPTTPI